METIPNHHLRYSRAWSLYQEKGLSEELKISLENEMDSAQNLFGWQEFQDFKKTLPGYCEYWQKLGGLI